MLLPLLVVAGAGSVGFIGLGLAAAVTSALPVEAAYSGGSANLVIQVCGFVFNQVLTTCEIGFIACAAAAVLTVGALFLVRFDQKPTDAAEPLMDQVVPVSAP